MLPVQASRPWCGLPWLWRVAGVLGGLGAEDTEAPPLPCARSGGVDGRVIRQSEDGQQKMQISRVLCAGLDEAAGGAAFGLR